MKETWQSALYYASFTNRCIGKKRRKEIICQEGTMLKVSKLDSKQAAPTFWNKGHNLN